MQRRSPITVFSGFATWLAGGLRWRARAVESKIHAVVYTPVLFVRNTLGLHHPEATLISDSQQYWNDPSNQHLRQYAHWRGSGIFKDESRWLALGREHLRLYEAFARMVGLKPPPVKRIVEWGCGGGMNAVHFGHLAAEFCGVDVSSESLDECGKQMSMEGLRNFTPILIDASDPEAALAQVPGPCDLFLSTYVFEALPSPEYGIRVLRIARQLVETGGLAIIQIKYHDNWKNASRRWNYAKNLARTSTFRIEEFWVAAEQCGFVPKTVTLVPKQPMVNDRNYAYFLLQKPDNI
jgi:cyclopropane fatty-acyl-phospholipid synthase-like methyltransferase